MLDEDEEVVQQQPIPLTVPIIEPDDSISCICGSQLDNQGLMIGCDKCDKWVHAVCYQIHPSEVPDQFFCKNCEEESPVKNQGVKRGREEEEDEAQHAQHAQEVAQHAQEAYHAHQVQVQHAHEVHAAEQQQQQQQQQVQQQQQQPPPVPVAVPEPVPVPTEQAPPPQQEEKNDESAANLLSNFQ